MAKLTKKQIEKIYDLTEHERKLGFLVGQKSVFELFRDNAISSIDRNYTSTNNCSTIKMCNKQIDTIQKEIKEAELERNNWSGVQEASHE